MIKITEQARDEIRRLLDDQERDDLALRVAITGRGPQGFAYDLHFVPLDEIPEGDPTIDAERFKIVLDAPSAEHLEGAQIDYKETEYQRGFLIDNPNTGWKDPVAAAVQRVIDTSINPGVASHGGFVTLLGVKEGIAWVRMGGGCQGCGMADMTLTQGIAAQIQQAVPEIVEVRDATDHASGQNPFYPGAGSGNEPTA